jgi:hypothetical protein
MNRTKLILLTALCTVASVSPDIGQTKRGFFQCDTAEIVTLTRGTTFVLDTCDWAVVFNEQAIRKMVGQNIKLTEALQLLQKRIELGNQISSLQDSVMDHMRHMDSIQTQSYALLHKNFETADGLILRSTQNTDRALNYIKKVKITGYIATGVLGAVSGGILVGQVGSQGTSPIQFSWPGALAGAVVGCAVYWVIMDILD